MPSILVIEPDASFREILAETLAANGYDVACAINGSACFESDACRDCCFVILDVFLPRRADYDTIQALKTTWPGVRIIATSESRASCRAEVSLNLASFLGADAGLKKPLAVEKVLQTVKSLGSPAAA
ncbi:response regulator transcription factor [Oceanidesulfovibrio indonesiensis]|nr:response regulator [Oceanidesulfovibrio indonesiensis]